MTESNKIDTLFLDLGGVLLTGGWDRNARSRAARQFLLDEDELQERHNLIFDSYEKGKFSLDEYLTRVVFYDDRSFTKREFKHFMFDQSRALPGMIPLIRKIKYHHGLKTVLVSNEGRTLAEYRIRKFRLGQFVDIFIFSCFVQSRKPETDIYRIALDISQADPEHVVYLDDREIFVEVAEGIGITGILHRGYDSTCRALSALGFPLPEQDPEKKTERGYVISHPSEQESGRPLYEQGSHNLTI
jgi:putative hydrolase of the HAD superfamily